MVSELYMAMKIGAISTPPNEAANYEYHPEIIIILIHMIYKMYTGGWGGGHYFG